MVPWVHYVVRPEEVRSLVGIVDTTQPLQVSYSELYLVLSFFIGPPGEPGLGRDDLAREIAENGVAFAKEFWRWEDMQSYMIRLLLEWVPISARVRRELMLELE